MDTKASFSIHISDTISHQIIPKNYYDLRQTILNIIVDITLG